MEYLRSSDGGRFSDGRTVWNFDALPPGATKTVSHTLKAVSSGAAESRIEASATCAEGAAAASLSETMEIEGVAALLLEVIDVDDPIEIGNEVMYEIRVTNQGTSDTKGIRLLATLPPQMSYVKLEGPTEASVDGQTIRFGLIQSLAPKKQAVYQLKAKAEKAGDVRFNVKMTIEGSEVPVQESESTFLY
jgi:uncharacterized repeat protein (TIGR01451 family)